MRSLLVVMVLGLWGMSLAGCSNDQAVVGGPSFSLLNVASGGGLFVAGEAGGASLVSSDGRHWVAWPGAGLQPLEALTWTGSRFAALGYAVLGGDGSFMTAANGVFTQSSSVPSSALFGRLLWDGARYLAAGESGKLLLGEGSQIQPQWREVATGVSDRITGLLWEGSRYRAVTSGGQVLTSTDGLQWAVSTVPGNPDLLAVAGDTAGHFVAVGAAGSIRYSADGAQWQAVDSGVPDILWDVIWAGDRFVAVGHEGVILESLDGLSWQRISSGVSSILTGVAWNGSLLVAVGMEGTVLYWPPGGPVRRGTIDSSRF